MESGGFMAMNHENIMGNAQFNDETTTWWLDTDSWV